MLMFIAAFLMVIAGSGFISFLTSSYVAMRNGESSLMMYVIGFGVATFGVSAFTANTLPGIISGETLLGTSLIATVAGGIIGLVFAAAQTRINGPFV